MVAARSLLLPAWVALSFLLLLSHPLPTRAAAPPLRDTPFRQDTSEQYSNAQELQSARFLKVAVNRDGIVYVLTDLGLARLFDSTLALDRSFRPLAGRRVVDIAVQRGLLFLLLDDQLLSNDQAGNLLLPLPRSRFHHLAVATDGTALLAGEKILALVRDHRLLPIDPPPEHPVERIFAADTELLVLLRDHGAHRVVGTRLVPVPETQGATTLALRGRDLIVGSADGYWAVNLDTGRRSLDRQNRLPATNLTRLVTLPEGIWIGSTRGAFARTADGFVYYASRRWLKDDHVVDLALDPAGDTLVLTTTGLSRLRFRPMTLAEKAAHYDRKIRQRHIRYGFCSELRLTRPGDPTSAEMIDTDNDGTWSNYYLASQAFRYAATRSEEARRNAWETFTALERLETISGIPGFPARTFERSGFKFSDPDRWHSTPDGHWEWKGTTSSDEITAHTFGCAVLWEVAAQTNEERARIARFHDRIMQHILRNDYYLVDIDGKPTLWGRWHPDYVNGYPPSIVDRRLNSAELIAMLQFAYRATGNDLYRERAFDLLNRSGYLDNIRSSMRLIKPTPGHVHQGNDMGNEWNHSDDLLAFVTYWVLHRFAFNDQLRAHYTAAIRDHWEIERAERSPLWNIVYASTGAASADLPEALWTLRRFPLDLVDWTVTNSHRQDLTRLPDNFRNQQTKELLPPGERRIMRWNGNPFVLDGGAGGQLELAGDEFLLPYWMARYLKLIE